MTQLLPVMIQQNPYVQEQLRLTADRKAKMNGTSPEAEQDKIKAHFAFGLASGIMPDLGARSEKESFVVDVRYEVCVLSARVPTHLCVKAGQANHDIYVLYDTDESWPVPRPMGWMWGARVRKSEPTDGYHRIPVEALISFESLVKMMRKHKLLGRAA